MNKHNESKSLNPGKKPLKRRKANYRAVIICGAVICIAACMVMILVSISPQKYEIAAGESSNATIPSPREVIDTVSTQALIEKEREAVKPIYKEDVAVTEAIETSLNDYYEILETVRNFAQQKYMTSLILTEEPIDFTPSKIHWPSVLSKDNIDAINTMTENIFSEEEIYTIASIAKADLARIKEEITLMINKELKDGVQAEHLDECVLRLSTQVYANQSYSEAMRYLAVKSIKILYPNMIYDEVATEAAKEKVAELVTPVIYKKGQNIVMKGEIVTRAQVAVLHDLGLIKDIQTDNVIYFGLSIYMLLLFAMYITYMFTFEKKLMQSIKEMTILYIIILLVVAASIVLSKISWILSAVFFGVILNAALLKPRTALMTAVLLSFLLAPVTAATGEALTSNEGILSLNTFIYAVYVLIGGIFGIFIISRTQHRISFIIAGLACGLSGAIVIIAFGMINSLATQNMIDYSAYSLVSGLMGGLLALGLMPVFESTFKMATPTKLLELLNPNQKLLRRLSIEAPSTYNHSTVCANLAERGAEAIDANALLARTAGYYHDIGKLKNPQMFTENQRGINPHDSMSPDLSAKTIKEHVSYGLHLAAKNNLPREIIELIEQHHGTYPMTLFYMKAKNLDENVSIDDYRYPYRKPQTKEAAIIMLADVTEAAVKSTGIHDSKKIMDLLDKIFSERCNDHQFDECDISLKDLQKLKAAFLGVYEGVFHDRVKYPGEESLEK